MNCTQSNYTEAAATSSAAQQHCSITVKTVESENVLTYSNYTQAAVTYSSAQQHSAFTVQILKKLYSL